MKIIFHDNSINLRGTSVALYDYAIHAQKSLEVSPVILYDSTHPTTDQRAMDKFKQHFPILSYADPSDIDKIISDNGVDAFFCIKRGRAYESDFNVGSRNVPTFVNANSVCTDKDVQAFHDHYRGVFAFSSRWLSGLLSHRHPFVPHMIDIPSPTGDLREELGIPQDDIVFGRTGGADTFDIPFANHAVHDMLNSRKDVWFLFQNTNQFIQHDRAIFLPPSVDMNYKSNFIATCDAMLHARNHGESFGLACGEFSTLGKPVITYANSPEKSHIDILGPNGLYYTNKESLMNILSTFSRDRTKDWNFYRDYTPEVVMEKFKQIYLT